MSATGLVDAFDRALAQNIKAGRAKHGMTQGDLAEAMSRERWTPATVAQVESGRRRVLAIEAVRLANVLTAQLSDLLPPVSETTPDRVAIRDEERKLAARLGLEPRELQAIVHAHYGHPLATERDARIPAIAELTPRSRQAMRGRAMRAIQAELMAAV